MKKYEMIEITKFLGFSNNILYLINRNAAWRASILYKNVCSVTDQILQILVLPWGLPSNIMK